jgi:hypothetical protein
MLETLDSLFSLVLAITTYCPEIVSGSLPIVCGFAEYGTMCVGARSSVIAFVVIGYTQYSSIVSSTSCGTLTVNDHASIVLIVGVNFINSPGKSHISFSESTNEEAMAPLLPAEDRHKYLPAFVIM